MKYLIIIAAFFLIGCGETEEQKQRRLNHGYEKICLQGVAYWRSHYQFAPVYDTEGNIETCDMGN